MATKHYEPMGVNHDLQSDITNLMHRLVMATGEFTLAELGYLHMNVLTYDLKTQSIQLKLYFDIRLAARRDRNRMVDGLNIAPVDQLYIFHGYFFVGQLDDVVTYEKILAPKYEVTGDELGRAHIRFKNSQKMTEVDTLVLNCSFPLTMAAINNISLTDPAYKPTISIIAKAGTKATDKIVSNVRQDVVPVAVDIQYTEGYGGYNRDDAITYLQNLAAGAKKSTKNQDKIIQAVDKRTKKAKKKADTSSKWMSKYA